MKEEKQCKEALRHSRRGHHFLRRPLRIRSNTMEPCPQK
uniref:Uncharacterized protein n=1 Tax=Arundo donax TaxID=35708 RepID=A0A0A9C982_ARUDO